MKVLSPPEVDKKRREQEDFQVQKASQLNDLVREQTIALNDLRDRNRIELEKLARQFIKFSEEMGIRKSALTKEVDELEDRKRKALEPIEAIESRAKEKLNEAIVLEDKLNHRISNCDAKEKEIAGQERKLEEEKAHLVKWEERIKEGQEVSTLLSLKSEKAKEDSDRARDDFNRVFEMRTNELTEERRLIQQGKDENLVKQKFNENQKTKNEEERIRLNDRVATLQAAFEELRQKQNDQRPT